MSTSMEHLTSLLARLVEYNTISGGMTEEDMILEDTQIKLFMTEVKKILEHMDINYEYLQLEEDDPNLVYTRLQLSESVSLRDILSHNTNPFDGPAVYQQLIVFNTQMNTFKDKILRISKKNRHAIDYIDTIKGNITRLMIIADNIRKLQHPLPQL